MYENIRHVPGKDNLLQISMTHFIYNEPNEVLRYLDLETRYAFYSVYKLPLMVIWQRLTSTLYRTVLMFNSMRETLLDIKALKQVYCIIMTVSDNHVGDSDKTTHIRLVHLI